MADPANPAQRSTYHLQRFGFALSRTGPHRIAQTRQLAARMRARTLQRRKARGG